MTNEHKFYASWLNLRNKREVFFPGCVILSRLPGNFVSDAICAFANEKGERGMASHAAVVINIEDAPYKMREKAVLHWICEGFEITPDTVWVAESTFPISRIAPLDYYFRAGYETLVVGWRGLPRSHNSKIREEISKRAISQIGRVYPVWRLIGYALDKATAWTGLGLAKAWRKMSLRVCSRFVAYACNTNLMIARYGHVFKDNGRMLLLKYDEERPGSVGIPINEATPDDLYDSVFETKLFNKIISTYPRG